MQPRKYVVVPQMEGRLKNIRKIAGNLWFSWNVEAVELFDYLDEQLWKETNHNPLQTLIRLSRHRLNQIRKDEGFLAHAERVFRHFKSYMNPAGIYEYHLESPIDFTTAYFSLEFGITESLPLYSGGLGILAGDHLKSASDLNVPVVGVGLLYQEGYFRQRLSIDGWQQEYYPRTETDTLPLERQRDASGGTLLIGVDLAGETLWCRVMKVNVGRVALYLLDADIPENPQRLRNITAKLYGGDSEMRICQEILLGIGGCRALAAIGIKPVVFHLNEGHAAFTLIERMRHFVEEEGLSIEEASEMIACQSILTIHTPVPAGNDVFERGLVEKYLGQFCRNIGLNFEKFLGMGRLNPSDSLEGFCMTILGLKMTSRANGVSRVHSEVAKKMWREVWPHAEPRDVPITHLTNGVHIPSYISRDLLKIYDRYLEPGWTEDPDNEKIWEKADKIPDTELWRTHERCRSRLVYFVRRRVAQQLKARGASPADQEIAERILDPEALTICFARRFAAYKRPTLLFREPERLAKFLNQTDFPAQLIFAGKAHPADNNGKEMISKIIQLTKQEPFRNRIAFIEDYDINVCRYMVQGADVWLNTPRRPMEACGTSGMKAAANGALNLSILDGWWDEGYRGDNGWAIGRGEEYDDLEYQDEIESRALYDILEESVKPLFYEKGVDDLPREWIRLMKRSIQTICPFFNSHRMVSQYVETCYVPSATASSELQENSFAALKSMMAWKKSIREDWDKIAIRRIEIPDAINAMKGRQLEVKVAIDTAGHKSDELKVELLHGPLDLRENFKECRVTRLSSDMKEAVSNGEILFSGLIPLTHTGLYGYLVRLTPEHPNLAFSHKFELVHTG